MQLLTSTALFDLHQMRNCSKTYGRSFHTDDDDDDDDDDDNDNDKGDVET
jgi:hypothetical protein